MATILDYVPLASDVLAVAVKGTVNDWAVYIKAVPGECHEDEVQNVADNGAKISFELSKILFPHIVGKYIWRN